MTTKVVSDSKLLLIVTAVGVEQHAISPVVKHWLGETPAAVRSPRYENIIVEQLGVRSSRLGEVMPRYAHCHLAGIISAGLGGGLDPELAIADVVLDQDSHQCSRVLDFINAMSGGQRCQLGKMYTSKQVIARPEEKKELFQKTGCNVVDMESRRIRDYATRHNTPWLGVRAISDTAFDAMPKEFVRMLDDGGNISFLKLASSLATSPSLLKHMLRLRKTSHDAARQLANTIGAIIRSGWPF
ncbi:MAG: hypothetical protein HKL96_09305 [Phycisphaerales bacterium]|nr:hypothetical protein [Phycisphaerales bacterium]